MNAIVSGDREWCSDVHIITVATVLETLPLDTVIIHGGARGVDRIAHAVARELGLEIRVYPADWDRFGKSAGPIRNREMLVQGQPDIVLCFHDDIEHSYGTKNMYEIARKAGVKTILTTSYMISS